MAKPATLHPSIISRLDPEYAAFHNDLLIHLPQVQVHQLPWDPSVRNAQVVPGSSDPLPVGKVEDFNLSRCRVRVFTPEGGRSEPGWPVFIFFHGGTQWTLFHMRMSVSHLGPLGGWTLGNIDTNNTFCANACKGKQRCRHSDLNYTTYISGANCVVVSVDYRLAPENPYPEAVEDAVEALQWVWQNGTSMLGIDTKRIAVGGTSRHVVFRQEILTNADS